MQTKIEKLKPPAGMLSSPPAPKVVVPPVLVRHFKENWEAEQAAREVCHAKLDALRKWFED